MTLKKSIVAVVKEYEDEYVTTFSTCSTPLLSESFEFLLSGDPLKKKKKKKKKKKHDYGVFLRNTYHRSFIESSSSDSGGGGRV